MKKIVTHIAMSIFAIMIAVCFTSCDDDVDTAYDLNGIWEGTIYGDYYYNRYGSAIATTEWDTQILFDQNGDFSSGGSGVEVDYNRTTREVTRSTFTWKVSNGRIYITYWENPYKVVINDYELYSRAGSPRFKGNFLNWDTGEEIATFDLIKTSGLANWAKQKTVTSLEE